MKNKKLYIGIGVLALLGLGGFIIYRIRKSNAKKTTISLDPSGSSTVATSDNSSKGINTPFGSLSTIQKAIKIAQEQGINKDNLNRRLA